MIRSGAARSHTIFLHLTVTAAWLELDRDGRDEIISSSLLPALRAHAHTTTLRWFDADAYSASPTDVAMISTSDLGDWSELLSTLKDSPLFSTPYYRLDRVIVTDEAGPVGPRGPAAPAAEARSS